MTSFLTANNLDKVLKKGGEQIPLLEGYFQHYRPHSLSMAQIFSILEWSKKVSVALLFHLTLEKVLHFHSHRNLGGYKAGCSGGGWDFEDGNSHKADESCGVFLKLFFFLLFPD